MLSRSEVQIFPRKKAAARAVPEGGSGRLLRGYSGSDENRPHVTRVRNLQVVDSSVQKNIKLFSYTEKTSFKGLEWDFHKEEEE